MSKRKYNYAQFEEELDVLLGQDLIIEWRALGPGHYRINGETDIWPRNKKYGLLKADEHGNWVEYGNYESLEKLLE